ncbi:MAG: flagellar biosynthesis anti-sigma factor FlgM [Campylobacterales bacterium]|nr:flagellar biosynthesis anti-sigma factor FlgM [Campylobacterales bacterium]
MISQYNSAATRSAMNTTVSEQKDVKKSAATPNAQLTDENRVEQLKASINSGEYKIDLDALSEKVAQELL